MRRGEGVLGELVRRGLWGCLCGLKGAFGSIPEHGWKASLEQFLHFGPVDIGLGSSFLRGAAYCGVWSSDLGPYLLDARRAPSPTQL